MDFIFRLSILRASSSGLFKEEYSMSVLTCVPVARHTGSGRAVVLSAENHRQFFLPRGFVHGFLVLSDYAVFCYKCDDVYHPNDEGGLMWNDPDIAIEWPTFDGDDTLDASKLVLSDKDMRHPHLADIKL